jgi:hypothetical protein
VTRHRRCCASPQMIIEEPVQRLPHGGEIAPAIIREPPTPDQHVDFGLAQLDPDAAQPFLAPVPVAAHPLGTGRARPGWRSRERRVGHVCLYYTAGAGKRSGRPGHRHLLAWVPVDLAVRILKPSCFLLSFLVRRVGEPAGANPVRGGLKARISGRFGVPYGRPRSVVVSEVSGFSATIHAYASRACASF